MAEDGASLDPLIRYRKHGVEEKQRLLAQLYSAAEELARRKADIEAQMARETALAAQEGNGPETLALLNNYLDGARQRIQALDEERATLEERIALAQEDMRAAFAEMKKIEMVADARAAEEESALNAKQEQELSEIAIDQYRRNLEE